MSSASAVLENVLLTSDVQRMIMNVRQLVWRVFRSPSTPLVFTKNSHRPLSRDHTGWHHRLSSFKTANSTETRNVICGGMEVKIVGGEVRRERYGISEAGVSFSEIKGFILLTDNAISQNVKFERRNKFLNDAVAGRVVIGWQYHDLATHLYLSFSPDNVFQQGGTAIAPTLRINISQHQCIAQFLSPDVLFYIFVLAVVSDADIPHFKDEPGEEYLEEEAVAAMPGLGSIVFAPQNISQTVDIYRRVFTPEKLAFRLKKSGVAPLTLSLALGFYDSDRFDNLDSLDTLHTFLDTVFSERRRWKKFSFLSFFFRKYITGELPIFDDLPLLEELSMRIPLSSGSQRPLSSSTKIDLSTCTELRTLELDGDFDLISDGTVLKKLKHVELFKHGYSLFSHSGTSSTLQISSLLQLAPAIVTLIVDVYPSQPPRDLRTFARGEIRLDHLTKLHLRTSDKEKVVLPEAGALLNRLVLPALETLNLEVAQELDVVSFIKRSGCNIRAMSLDGSRYALTYEMLDSIIVTWLSHMPELLELFIEGIDLACGLNVHLTLRKQIVRAGEEGSANFGGDGSSDNVVRSDNEDEVAVGGPGQSSGGGGDDDCSYTVVGLCHSLQSITLLECENGSLSGLPDFVNMVGSRMRGVKGSVGKVERFKMEESDVSYIEKDETILKWIAEGVDFQFD
ncbi:hypothetical protein SCHPADRAFT_892842 [Schizopora paradoxa]|uniref:Uncharacterized protein n=1 Tax=Schizopora paradoxa TaxID=27342 RepID=A0A0H2RE05_9AGAM|nr:hypothetical protein SCHPADRAFT_892842 [Schizopora paradoxa]